MQYRSFHNDLAGAVETLTRWHQQGANMAVLALVAESSRSMVPELQRQVSGLGLSFSGAIFPELIVDRRFVRSGVLLLGMRNLSGLLLMPCESVERDANHLFDKFSPLAGRAGEDTLFLMMDSMVPHIASLLDEIYLKFADRVGYVGVNAGSETFQPMPCLFDENRIIGNGMLALLLHNHAGSLLNHGYVVPEAASHLATATDGHRIVAIDWRPAFDVYRELVMERFGQEITVENFYQYSVHFPFGMLRANGEVVVRIPVSLAEDGSLYCVGEVPSNTMLVVLDSEQKLLSDAVSHLGDSVSGQGWQSPLTFYCAGRRMHLGVDAAEREIELLSETVGHVDGALSLGEIGNLSKGDCPLFHNGTLICCDWNSA